MLEEALEHLVKGIVDNPDDVAVDLVNGRRGKTLEVRVHPDDLGKVIGRGGRTAKALRQVMTGVGAQPTEAVAAILRETGDWQKFKGEPAPAPMKVAAPKPDKKAAYEEAARAAADEPAAEATTPRKKAAAQAGDAIAEMTAE